MHKTHITVDGDTFDALALQYYNDENLASIIIQSNPDYCDTLIFESGVTLVIPTVTAMAYPETLPPWRRDV